MKFEEVLQQIIQLLEQRGRITYRAIKRQFELDDDYLEDLKIEVIKGQQLAIDENGEVLVWTGRRPGSVPSSTSSKTPPSDSLTSSPALAASDAQRRQLTVLFCDLVESTALSSRIDPEELREILQNYQNVCSKVIQCYAGHVAQYLGDGLLVYFGYPQAHEEDPQRAVLAALGIIDAMAQFSTNLQREKGIQPAIRIGIHTGLVVVGAIGSARRQDQLALGETPNIAAKIQGLARTNTVVVSGTTYSLVQGFFRSKDLGPHQVKGISAPVQLFQMLQETGVRNRLDIARQSGLTPFVGHESEMTLLLERWELSKIGRGQLVLIGGESGIGKSRLVKVLQERILGEGTKSIEFRCSPYYTNSVYYPIIDYLIKQLGFCKEDTATTKLDKLESYFSNYKFPFKDAMPLLALLLALPQPSHFASFGLTPRTPKTTDASTACRVALPTCESATAPRGLGGFALVRPIHP